MKTFFLKSNTQNVVKKLFLDPFLKKLKLKITSLDQSFIQSVFIVRQGKGYQDILTLSCRPLAFTSYKGFLKKQKVVWN